MRYFIELAFNGKNYHGWQIQPDASSVQQTLEESLSTLLRKKIEIVGAGRTDAGVHAKQLFAHFDTADDLQNEKFKFKLNSFLPNDIAVKSISKVNETAHARFDALCRTYEYHVHTEKDPFLDTFSYRVVQIPDIKKMNEAAEMLCHYTNFQCFSKSKTDVKTYHCKVKVAAWEQHENRLIFTITADRFLRNMVRAIVGTLLEIGLGKMEVNKMHEIIESKNRSNAGASVPAKGLYLTNITYPKELFI
ncbi:tRNA pseudouridine(38-40) synthase TruA [Planktosalinus lacus]|uniref:tRNA pseudouridine synthase A n=1 Tax=Planktosalinus lacus TaxID=1526573 RepID=A0A8J2VAF3_9FLAO|nr:tRNA pseudouridine(38-40) synthase TruA [Planktosalinus lacus]GGD91666.1 tRNA pseudouridine synthase A [Planktosalinus lacus]